jgi:hypothetical protein
MEVVLVLICHAQCSADGIYGVPSLSPALSSMAILVAVSVLGWPSWAVACCCRAMRLWLIAWSQCTSRKGSSYWCQQYVTEQWLVLIAGGTICSVVWLQHLPRKTSWLVTCLISVLYQADTNCHIFTEYVCIDMQGTWVTNTVFWWAFIVESLLAFGLLLNCGVRRNYPFRGDCACSWIKTWSSFAVVGSGIRLSQLSSLGTLYCKGVWFFCLASLMWWYWSGGVFGLPVGARDIGRCKKQGRLSSVAPSLG